jgi:hypothetical protein
VNQAQLQLWLPPVLSLFGTLIVVLFAAWMNTRSLSAQIDGLRSEMNAKFDALRAEMKQNMAELRLEFHTDLSGISARLDRIDYRVERLEEQRGLVRP